jgi:glycosyltransferase involved in cell wall biosynthesis
MKNGGGRFSRNLIEQVKKEKVEVKVLTTVGSAYKEEELLIYSSKLKLFFSLFKIRRIFKDYDVIHTIDGLPYAIVAAICNFGLGKKLIITAIGSGSIKPLYNKWSPILKWAYRRADRITAISSYTADEIKKKISGLNIEVIVPGIDYNHFIRQEDRADEYQSYIISVGRIKERKGQFFSIKAFAKVAAKYKDLKYIIVGSNRGQYYKKLQSLIKELNIVDKVIFKENISDQELFSLYKNAELFILLPQNIDHDIEGFGLVFVEAAAFGLPVIGALNSGAIDAILDKQNGFLIDPQDIDEAAKKIEYILSDENLQNNFRIKSVEFAKSLDWSIIIKKYLKIYELLFKGSV